MVLGLGNWVLGYTGAIGHDASRRRLPRRVSILQRFAATNCRRSATISYPRIAVVWGVSDRSSCYPVRRVRGSMADTRKIAAILAADVVGFSRMTSADEDGTLARLRALRGDLIDPTVAAHNGRVFKRTGDGALVEFRSVVDAVRCAIAVQNSMVERFSTVPGSAF